MSELVDLVALTLLPVWRWRVITERIRVGLHPFTILEEQCAQRKHQEGGERCEPQMLRSRATAAIERAARDNIALVAWTDPRYPAPLLAIPDPPPVVWMRGTDAIFSMPAVAVVGSRAGSPYALAVAERLSADLAARGVLVISGLARGVDAAAHRGALSVDGATAAVLGCGVDVIYPPEHRALSIEIARKGAVVSELVPGTPPRAIFFPQRNRIISGLSRAIVVIEAGDKSGSLITARCALEQGREVLAVPGNVLSGRNRGGHALLRDGAKIVENADDILEELGMLAAQRPDLKTGEGADVDSILECLLPGEPCDLDALSERLGLAPSRLLPRLLELELKGLIGRAGGGRFVRFDRSC